MPRSLVVRLSRLLGLVLVSTVARAAETPPVESITAAALRGHIFFLASDALGGRPVNSRGFEVAAQYAESQFRAAGVLPLSGVGAGGAFRQDVPVTRRTVSGPVSVVVTNAKGAQVFPEGQDVKWFQGEIYPVEHRALPLVYVGYGISEPGHGWDDFEGLDVRNKVVLLLLGAPLRDGKPVLPEAVHARYAPPSAVFRKMLTLVGRRAAGIIVLPSPELTAGWDGLRSKTLGPSDEYDDSAPEVLHVASLFVSKPAFANAIFAGQRRVPPGMGKGARETTRGFHLANVSVSLTGTFKDEPIPAWNVAGLVQGTDPVLRDEYVVVCAHLDSSTPKEAGEVYNGADDDASGCAGVLEIARVVALHPPRRSVVFALFTGEESALAGSRHFVSHCPVPLDRIVADVDLDMIGRTDAASQTDRAHYALDSGKITPELTRLIGRVNERTVRWPLKHENPSGNSDNLSFHFVGIPGVSFYSGHHDDVNESTDDAEKLDYDKAEKITRLACEVTMELGNATLPWR